MTPHMARGSLPFFLQVSSLYTGLPCTASPEHSSLNGHCSPPPRLIFLPNIHESLAEDILFITRLPLTTLWGVGPASLGLSWGVSGLPGLSPHCLTLLLLSFQISTAPQPLWASLGMYPEPQGLYPQPPTGERGSQQVEGNQIPLSYQTMIWSEKPADELG